MAAVDREPSCGVGKRAWVSLVSVLLFAGCAGLQPPQANDPNVFVLDARPLAGPQRANRDLVLAVSVPRARPGFDTAKMVYVRQPHQLEYFATNRWADTPARMLAPLIARAVEEAGGFRAVVRAPGALPADLRLDTELIRLQHDFGNQPSRVRLTLRVQLSDVRTRRVLAAREFDEVERAPSENAYGGVIAANRALQRLLAQLADFSVEQSGGR